MEISSHSRRDTGDSREGEKASNVMMRLHWSVKLGMILLFLLGGAWLGLLWYLSSDAVAQQVAQQLEQQLGASVRVKSASVGVFGSTTIRGIEIREAADSQKPWVTVEKASMDVSALDVAGGGASPTTITLTKAVVELRFAKDGAFLTKMPKGSGTQGSGKTPVIRLTDSTLKILQEGRDPVALHGLDAELSSSGTDQQIKGTANDPYWGNWTAAMNFPGGKRIEKLTLESAKTHVTQEKLKKIPFVPGSVWESVTDIDGTTPVSLTLTFDQTGKVHYRVDMKPENTTVRIPSIHLKTGQTQGTVLVEDGVVTLEQAEGTFALGKISIPTKAVLDFRGEGSSYRFDQLRVRDADMDHLPAEWKLPAPLKRFSGKLKVDGDNFVVTVDKETNLTGKLQAEIENPTLKGITRGKVKNVKLKMDITADGIELQPAEGTDVPPPPLPGKDNPLPAPSPEARALPDHQFGKGEELFLVSAPLEASSEPPPPPSAVKQLARIPLSAISLVQKGARLITKTITDSGTTILKYVPNLRSMKSPGLPQKYLEIEIELEDVDVQEVLKTLNLKSPIDLGGTGTFQIRAAVPVDGKRDLKLIRASANVRMSPLLVGKFRLESVMGRAQLLDGVIRLESLQGKFGKSDTEGTFLGSATLQLEPRGELKANLNMRQVPVDQLTELLPNANLKATGRLSGQVQLTADGANLEDTSRWTAQGELATDQIQYEDIRLSNLRSRVNLMQNRATFTDVRGVYRGFIIQGNGSIDLANQYPWQAKLNFPESDLTGLQKLIPNVTLPIRMEGVVKLGATAKGTLKPVTSVVMGTAASQELKVEDFTFANVSFDWSFDDRLARIRNLKAGLSKAALTGEITIPLKPEQAGSISLNVKDLDVGVLTSELKSFPIPLQGKISGTVEGTIPVAKMDQPRGFDGKIDLASKRLLIRGISTERLTGSVRYQDNIVNYQLKGEALGGTMRIRGIWPPRAADPADQKSGKLNLKGIRINLLLRALDPRSDFRDLNGVLDLDLNFEHDAKTGFPLGNGKVSLTDVRWGREELSDRIVGDIQLTGTSVQLRNARGRFARGALALDISHTLTQPGRGEVMLRLTRAELSQVLSPFPELESRLSGQFDLMIRSAINHEWRGRGELVLSQGKAAGVEIHNWRVPFDFDFAPFRNSGTIDVRDTRLNVSGGRVKGELHYRWGADNQLKTDLQFLGVDVRQLLRAVPGLRSRIGRGRLSGRIQLTGRNVSSVRDLNGSLDADLKEAQALSYPVLDQLRPFLRGQSAVTTFGRGTLRAKLSSGLIRIQTLALESDFLRLLGEGTIALQQGRLNLGVAVRTGELVVDPRLLQLIGIAVGAPIPVTVLARATEYLSNRALYLKVRGTVKNPSVRIEPLPILTEEAFRFLLQAGIQSQVPTR